ncbi:hypothetical protein [Chryseobacterium cheonjiense]|uniref:Uncharacterized protein n=1 Tax=Chryseobacterium cheonjiense TaxID=2728845 RepID=A0A7Y0A6S5_9FLAO|nr:hypothetical protein [Chryseobacterium cheonjiense]NML57709.1 hypothetical protein [Chryseobacterium cheonjiense]
MENLFKKLVTLFNELSSNDLIELHKESLFPQEFNLTDRFLQKYQKKISDEAGIEFNDDDIRILGLTSLAIKWNNKFIPKVKENINGGTSFLIYNSLCGIQDEWLKENPLNHAQKLVENLYSFNDSEMRKHMSQRGRGCFYREYAKWPLDIYFFDEGIRIKMNISLEDYIQALIDSCAVSYWQYFYVDIDELIKQNQEMLLRSGILINNPIEDKDLDSPRLKYLIDELEIITKNLPILFPEKDFSYHQDRLEQIKERARPYLL